MSIMNMFRLNPNNPFEEPSLPKAFYFPSVEKLLSKNQRKTCLSPNKMESYSKEIQSIEDAKFLHESHKLLTHEVPTREDGTPKHDTSSGSQFNESWPSTDKNVSSLSSHHTTSLSNTLGSEIETSKKGNRSRQPSINNPSTLSKYIERFRHGVPTSRENRENLNLSNTDDFWWLSPPTTTSTPNESKESSKLLPSTTETSPKLKRKKFGKPFSSSAPLQKSGRKLLRSQEFRPTRELGEAMDSDTTNLQTRTEMLIEKSENTLSDMSTPESIPKRPSSWMLQRQRQRVEDEPRTIVTRPRPAPEDDILYQWRLSRRLEKAQEQAKRGWTKELPDLGIRLSGVSARHTGPSVNTRDVGEPEFNKFSYTIEEHENAAGILRIKGDSETNGHDLTSKEFTEKGARTVDKCNVTNDKITEVMRQPSNKSKCEYRARTPTGALDEIKDDVRPNRATVEKSNAVQSVPLETNVPTVCFINDGNLPPHVHMMCDIVSCPQQQEYVNLRGSNTAIENGLPNVSTITRPTKDLPPKTSERVKVYEGGYKQKREELPTDPYSPVVNNSSSFGSPVQGEAYHETKVKTKETNSFNRRQLNRGITLTNDQDPDNGNMIESVIGQVISERLFAPTTSSRRRSTLGTPLDEREEVQEEEEKEEKENVVFSEKDQRDIKSRSWVHGHHDEKAHSPVDEDSPVFLDDEILVGLRQQANIYQEHIRNIDRLLQEMKE